MKKLLLFISLLSAISFIKSNQTIESASTKNKNDEVTFKLNEDTPITHSERLLYEQRFSESLNEIENILTLFELELKKREQAVDEAKGALYKYNSILSVLRTSKPSDLKYYLERITNIDNFIVRYAQVLNEKYCIYSSEHGMKSSECKAAQECLQLIEEKCLKDHE